MNVVVNGPERFEIRGSVVDKSVPNLLFTQYLDIGAGRRDITVWRADFAGWLQVASPRLSPRIYVQPPEQLTFEPNSKEDYMHALQRRVDGHDASHRTGWRDLPF